MKLIELLLRELKEWPLDTEQNNEFDRITQDDDGMLNGIRKGYDARREGGTWCGMAAGYILRNNADFDELKLEIADDWSTAIVTRADWDAYHAPATVTAQPAPTTPTLETMLTEWRDLEARAQAAQAEADALFEHAGHCHGEIVVRLAELGWGAPRGPMVPGEPVVTFDDGGWIEWKGGECPVPNDVVQVRLRASPTYDHDGGSALGYRWNHAGSAGDIVAYRLTPSTQP